MGDVVRTDIQAKRRAPVDARLATVAGRQHSVVSLPQLRALGATKAWIATRLQAGRLHPLHRGVYAVGHPILTDHGRWLAAVLALGDGSVLSHQPAGTLTGFLPKRKNDRPSPTDVTVPRRLKPRAGITPHAARNLRASDITTLHGIPVTTAARTLFDLSGTLHPQALERAMNEALVQRLVNLKQLGDQLDCANGLPAAAFKAAVANAAPTRSGLEDHVLREIRRRGLPRPQTNVRVGNFEVDCFYEDRNLVVEIDSNKYHRTPVAQRRDARKQQSLEAAGYTVVRVREDAIDEALDQLEEDHLGRV